LESVIEWLGSILTDGKQSKLGYNRELWPDDSCGWREIYDFGWVPLKDGRGYLLPLSSRQNAVNALKLYIPQNFTARIAKRLLTETLKWGVAQLLLPKVCVLVRHDVPPKDRNQILLVEHVREVLGFRDSSFAVSLGTPGPQRKPVLMVISDKGASMAYVKIGWNEQTRRLVENEKHALEVLRGHAFEYGILPRVLHSGEWHGKSLLVIEPFAMHVRHCKRSRLGTLHVQFLTEVAKRTSVMQEFMQSVFFLRLMSGLNTIRGDISSHELRVLETSLDLLTSRFGSAELPWVWRLGDFTPWNTGVDMNQNRVQAIDLEYAQDKSVPGWDIFHFLSSSFNGNIDQLCAIYSANRRMLPYFRSIDIAPESIPWLYVAYLLDLWIMWALMWKAYSKPKSPEAIKTFRKHLVLMETLTERIKSKGGGCPL